MAEYSLFWTTNALGDGAADYTQEEWIVWLRTMFAGDEDDEGVCLDVWNDLEATGVATPVSVNTGIALCHGFPYFNNSALNVAVGTPTVNTRVDLIVVRATEADREARIKLHAGVEGAGAPALTQNDGVVWEIPLWEVSITIGGVITLTDVREYIHPSIAVKLSMMDENSVDSPQYVDGSVDLIHMSADSVDSPQYVDGSIDTVHIGNDQVTPAKIPNRGRKFFVPAVAAYNETDVADILPGLVGPTAGAGTDFFGGFPFPDNKYCHGYGHFYVPEDFAGNMTMKAVIIPLATGNVYGRCNSKYGACGTSCTTHSSGPGSAAVGVTQDFNECVHSTAISNAAIGDIVALIYERDATDILDTIGASVSFFGWIISYTADS